MKIYHLKINDQWQYFIHESLWESKELAEDFMKKFLKYNTDAYEPCCWIDEVTLNVPTISDYSCKKCKIKIEGDSSVLFSPEPEHRWYKKPNEWITEDEVQLREASYQRNRVEMFKKQQEEYLGR